jgi:hypothetical protein
MLRCGARVGRAFAEQSQFVQICAFLCSAQVGEAAEKTNPNLLRSQAGGGDDAGFCVEVRRWHDVWFLFEREIRQRTPWLVSCISGAIVRFSACALQVIEMAGKTVGIPWRTVFEMMIEPQSR